jgi:glycerol-3-phosphate dehydrogenase (NAD(P)+)
MPKNMEEEKKKICIVGAGAIGTALANVLAHNSNLEVILYSIEEQVVDSINQRQYNQKYFPNTKLTWRLKASGDVNVLSESSVIFLAIPSSVMLDFVIESKHLFAPDAILVNMAKGLSKDVHFTIAESIQANVSQRVATLKGPTFARDLIDKMPTAFTLGSVHEELFPLFKEIVADTNVYLDFSTDLRGVELLSTMKNIYAIATGIIDAQFDSPNLRFMFLTKAFNEMRSILIHFGGAKKTIFKYCGYGDFGLTALNDLSRNRTLGLLIGKGFFSENISNMVLEGKNAVNIFSGILSQDENLTEKFAIINELQKVLTQPNYDIPSFVHHILNDD